MPATAGEWVMAEPLLGIRPGTLKSPFAPGTSVGAILAMAPEVVLTPILMPILKGIPEVVLKVALTAGCSIKKGPRLQANNPGQSGRFSTFGCLIRVENRLKGGGYRIGKWYSTKNFPPTKIFVLP